jgi:hypothetical protein
MVLYIAEGLPQLFAQDRVRRPVRSLARGAAVQRDITSRTLLGPLVAFAIETRLARRVVASSGLLLIFLRSFDEFGAGFLGSESIMARDKTRKWS